MLRSEASNSIYTFFPLPDKSSNTNTNFIRANAPCVMHSMGWERSYNFGGLVLNTKLPLKIYARYLNNNIAVFYAKTENTSNTDNSFIIAVFRGMSQAEIDRSHAYKYWKSFENKATIKYLQAFPEFLIYLRQHMTSPLDFIAILNIRHSNNKPSHLLKLFDAVQLTSRYLMSCMLADVHHRYIITGRGSFDMHDDNSKLYFNMRDSFRDFKPINSSFLRDTLTNPMFMSADMYLYARMESDAVSGFALSCCLYSHADDLASILLNQRNEIDSYLEESEGKTYLRFKSQYGDKVWDRLKAYENMWHSYIVSPSSNINIINRYLTNYAYAVKYEDDFKAIYPRRSLRFIYDDGKTTDTKDLNPTQKIKFTRSNILLNYLDDPNLKTIIFSPDTKKYYKEWDMKKDLTLMAEKTKGVLKEIVCYMDSSGHRCSNNGFCRNKVCNHLNLDENALTNYDKLPDCLSPGTLVVFNYTFEIGILIDIAEDYSYFTYLSIIGDKFRTIYPLIKSKTPNLNLPNMMPITYITQKELMSDSFRKKFPRLYNLNRDMLINIKKQ